MCACVWRVRAAGRARCAPTAPRLARAGLSFPALSAAARPAAACRCSALQEQKGELRKRLSYTTHKLEKLETEFDSTRHYLEIELRRAQEELEKVTEKLRRCGGGAWSYGAGPGRTWRAAQRGTPTSSSAASSCGPICRWGVHGSMRGQLLFQSRALCEEYPRQDLNLGMAVARTDSLPRHLSTPCSFLLS